MARIEYTPEFLKLLEEAYPDMNQSRHVHDAREKYPDAFEDYLERYAAVPEDVPRADEQWRSERRAKAETFNRLRGLRIKVLEEFRRLAGK